MLYPASELSESKAPNTKSLPSLYISAAMTIQRHPLLGHKVIDQAHLDPLVALGKNDVATMPSRAIHNLEPPDLRRDPATVQALNITHDELLLIILPALLEVGVADVALGRHPSRAALDVAEQPVAVLAEDVVEAAVLGRALEPAGCRLVDVHECDLFLGLVGGVGKVFVFADGEVDCCEADGFAREPADALQGQGRVGAVG